VVDDGDQRVEAICAGLDRVRYIGLAEPTSLGTKLNIGIEASRGDVIQKLDDDDYYHPEFLETAVGSLPEADRDESLVAWDCFLILHVAELQLHYSGHGWRAGGTLCFPRAMWTRHAFRDVSGPEDGLFIDDNQARVVKVCAPDQYVLVRHGRNTWTRQRNDANVDDRLRALPRDERELAAVVGPEAAAFYQSLAAGTQGS
jgi:glycosyltransferase involved in cell wall biosynthesis